MDLVESRMKAKDFTAELISDIADEFGYLVYKYACSGSSNGSIIYELKINDKKKYKSLEYNKFKITLFCLTERKIIDLHKPDSIDELRKWFDNTCEAFDVPVCGIYLLDYNPYGVTTTSYSPAINNTMVGATCYSVTNYNVFDVDSNSYFALS